MPPRAQHELEEFYDKFRPRAYSKGEIIVFPGETPEGIFLLSRGTIRQYDISNRGVDLVVNLYTPLALFPMSAALNKYPNRFFFNAATAVVAREAPVAELREFVRGNNEVAMELLAQAHRRLDIIMRRQTLMMSSDASSRLAYEIMLSCHNFGERQKDGTYTIRLNETELATRVGLARETVSRQMHELKNKNIVKITAEHISVVNLTLLEDGLANYP